MKHGVLIDRELLEKVIKTLYTEWVDDWNLDEKLREAISSAPDAVIPISNKKDDCKHCPANDGSMVCYALAGTKECPIITKE